MDTQQKASSERNKFNNISGHVLTGVNIGRDVDLRTIYKTTINNSHPPYLDSTELELLSGHTEEHEIIRIRRYSRQLGVDPMKDDIRVRRANDYVPADELVHVAAAAGDLEAINLLADTYEAKVSLKHLDGWAPIHRAAEGGQVNAMNLLACKYGVEVDERTDNQMWSLLHIAARNGRIEVIKLLSGQLGEQKVKIYKAKPAIDGKTTKTDVLFPATGDDHNDLPFRRDTANILSGSNAAGKIINPVRVDYAQISDDTGQSSRSLPLAEPQLAESITRTIEWRPGEPNMQDIKKMTPMHLAAINNHRVEGTIDALLEIGEKVDVNDENKWTPLHWAALNGNLDAVKYLLTRKANPNSKARSPYGATPLYLAKTVRKYELDKKDKDRYGEVMKHLKLQGGHDRSLLDVVIGKYYYPIARYTRSKMDEIAWEILDRVWLYENMRIPPPPPSPPSPSPESKILEEDGSMQ